MDEKTIQRDLKIEPYFIREKKENKGLLTVDDLALGNIIYLRLENLNYSKFIKQSKSSSVLVLGRFGKNLTRLESIKDKLRKSGFTPIVFDFKAPDTLDLIEIIVLLSLLSKLIIVDLSQAKSVPAELQAILSTLMIPVVPIINHKNSL